MVLLFPLPLSQINSYGGERVEADTPLHPVWEIGFFENNHYAKFMADASRLASTPTPLALKDPASFTPTDIEQMNMVLATQLTANTEKTRKSCQNMHVLQPTDEAKKDPFTYVCLDSVLAKKKEGKPCYAISIGIANIWHFDDLMIEWGNCPKTGLGRHFFSPCSPFF